MRTQDVFWSVVFVTIAMGSIIATDYVAHNTASLIGGNNNNNNNSKTDLSFGTWRVPVSWAHMVIGVVVFIASLFFPSPYGRHAPVDKNNAEAFDLLSAWVSWIIQELPTLLAVGYFAVKTGGASIVANPALLLFSFHYINRSLLFPLFLGEQATPVRAWVTFSALGYCIFNGVLHNAIDNKEAAAATLQIKEPLVAAAGVLVFVGGMYGNITADKHLTSLKKRYRRYVIPRHWIFTSLGLSCPNFFCEFVEWCGFAIATAGCCGWDSPRFVAAASFAVFTAANTFPRGIQHHQHYLKKFANEDYASLNRKAVIPFLL